MKYDDFINAFSVVSEIYKSEITQSVLNVYFTLLKQYDINDFKRVCVEIMREYKYNTLPKPAEFIERLEPPKDDIEIKAIKAYDLAIRVMARFGVYESVSFSDKAINATIESLGGWVEFGNRENNDFLRANFIRIYKAYAKNTDHAPKCLIGLSDYENLKNGYLRDDEICVLFIDNHAAKRIKKIDLIPNAVSKIELLLSKKGLL